MECKTLELRYLKAFCCVAQAGSFSKAAVMLAVAQPILSRQIKALEREVGVTLFFRNGRGVILTDAGRLLAGHAEKALQSVSQAIHELRMLQQCPTGTITIGLPPTIGAMVTAPILRRFQEAYRGVRIQILEGASGVIAEWLASGRLDVAVLHDLPHFGVLPTERLCEGELVLVGKSSCGLQSPCGGKVSGAQLCELTLVLPSAMEETRVVVDHALTQLNMSLLPIAEVNSFPAMMALLEEGIGYSILPLALVKPLIASGRLSYWHLSEPTMSQRFVLATSTSRITTHATRVLAQIVRDEILTLHRSETPLKARTHVLTKRRLLTRVGKPFGPDFGRATVAG